MDFKSKLIDNLIQLQSLENDGTSLYGHNEESTIDKSNGNDICFKSQCEIDLIVNENCPHLEHAGANQNSSDIELIEVNEHWVDIQCQYGGNGQESWSGDTEANGSGEVELIEVDEIWVDVNCQYGGNGQESWSGDTEANGRGEVELIEADENWVDVNCQYGGNGQESWSGDTEADGCGEIELIEVDENWVDVNCQYGGNGQESWSGDTEANGSGNADFYIQQDETGRIAELKKSLTELKDNSAVTKKGLTRKRRIFKMPLKERNIKKFELQKLMHPVRAPCGHTVCKEKVPEKRRSEINEQFWKMKYSERYTFGIQSISRKRIKQRRKNSQPKKNNTLEFFLKDGEGEITRVCKVFYLTTLGFTKKNDSFIKMAMGKTRYEIPLPRSSNRGIYYRPNLQDYEKIIDHINTFNPNVSHHRREHAPNKKYLPENLTITSMHKDFRQKYPTTQCSYYLYRRIVSNELNISFTKLGHEKCETCEEYDLHKKCNTLCDTCDLCEEYKFHRIKYTESRELYDVQRALNTEKKSFYSGDMEKVMMLPHLEMFKRAIFTPRLSAYNETFAPLGGIEKNPQSSKPVAIIWHEGISGRCKEDITSAFYKFFIDKKDVEEHVLWLDNCSSQNKNWTLFSFLVYIINSNLIKATTIQFNYFEPGHTFMSADSFHHQVEMQMKEMNKVYDFNDFETAVSTANSGHVTVLSMEAADFRKWLDCSSRTKRTSTLYLHEIVQVTATRGSYDLKCKKSFSSTEEFTLNFLQERYKKDGIPTPEKATSNCGVPVERKDSILKLCSIMKMDKTDFWRDLTVTQLATKNASKAKAANGNQRKKIQRQECKVKARDNIKSDNIKSDNKKRDTKKIDKKKRDTKIIDNKKRDTKKLDSKKLDTKNIDSNKRTKKTDLEKTPRRSTRQKTLSKKQN